MIFGSFHFFCHQIYGMFQQLRTNLETTNLYESCLHKVHRKAAPVMQ